MDFSSYFIIIISVGHNTKAITVYFSVFLLAGIINVLRKKYWLGFILTSLFAIFNLHSGHPQMTYYFTFMYVLLFIFKFFDLKNKGELPHFFKSVTIVGIAGLIAILVHLQYLLPTQEYTKETIRGKANLTRKENIENKTSGLDRDYITAWSYGKMESLNLLIPNLYGGGSEGFDRKSNVHKEIVNNFQNRKLKQKDAQTLLQYARTYWGPQPFTEGPSYLGAVVIFLFVLGIFILKGGYKWWLISATILSLMMAWGKNISWFTNFMIDYFPLYNKFRAPASAMVVLQLTIPFISILAIKEFFSKNISYEEKLKHLKYTSIITLGICAVFGFGGLGFLDYIGGAYDNIFKQAPVSIQNALVLDREELATSDSWRSFIFILFVAGILLAVLKKKINYSRAIIFIGILSLVDLWGVDKRFLNDTNFNVKSKKINRDKLFIKTNADKEILKDKSHYRVFNTTKSTMNDSETSYWHNSIGGYHGAKLRRYQELWDRQISKNNMQVINMLNTKYFIVLDKIKGTKSVLNTEANGNSWFVDKYIYADNSDMEMKILDTLKTKNGIVVDKNYKSILGEEKLIKDTSSYIKLLEHNLQYLKYEYNTKKSQIAVFSEVYYKYGWDAYIDGKLTPHFRANYILRAMKVPKGKHIIEFKFKPKSLEKGKLISNIGYIIFFLGVAFSIFMIYRENKAKQM